MTKYTEKIVNLETGETVIRDFTAQEIKDLEAAHSLALQEVEQEAEKQAHKASALTKLEALGLTEAEAKAVFGL